MRIASFNINGIKARSEALVDWLREAQPDGAPLRVALTAPTGKAPAGVALSGDGRIVAVADRDDDRLSAYDAATGRLVWQAATGSHPYAVAYHDGRFWTTDVQSDSVTVIEAASGSKRMLNSRRGVLTNSRANCRAASLSASATSSELTTTSHTRWCSPRAPACVGDSTAVRRR